MELTVRSDSDADDSPLGIAALRRDSWGLSFDD